MSPQQITWHQEVTYVSIVSMNTLGFRCKMQNEVSVREYMDILVKHYDVIPYNRTISSRCGCCIWGKEEWGLMYPVPSPVWWIRIFSFHRRRLPLALLADFTLAFPNSLGPQLLPYTWEGVWGLEDSPCLPRCIFNAVPWEPIWPHLS